MTAISKTDIELVQATQKGDTQAYELLVAKYQYKVVGLVNRFVQNEFEAQDIAQETFIKAYCALDKFRGDSAFYTWLYRIAVNEAKSFLLSKGRKPPAGDIDSINVEQINLDSSPMDTNGPEAIALQDEIRHAINEAIEGMPESLATTIKLRELEGMSYEEIAQYMDCPIGTVRSRIFRAREVIDAKLEPMLKIT